MGKVSLCYTPQNAIAEVENVEHLVNLEQLNLSKNKIVSVRGLAGLKTGTAPPDDVQKIGDGGAAPPLAEGRSTEQTAGGVFRPPPRNISSEGAGGAEGGEPGGSCVLPKLLSIDVSFNYIEEEEELVEFWLGFRNLEALYLQSNPSVRRIRNYRRRLVAGLPQLRWVIFGPKIRSSDFRSRAILLAIS